MSSAVNKSGETANHGTFTVDQKIVVPQRMVSQFGSCLDFKEMGRLACVNRTTRAARLEAVKEQLRCKTSLCLDDKEFRSYQKALGLRPNDWEGVLKHCVKLKTFIIPPTSTILIESIDEVRLAASLPETVTTLDLYHLHHFSDKGMAVLATKCPNLRSLKLPWTFTLGGHTGLSNEGLKAVLKGCQKLMHLQIENCNWVTDETLQLIRQHSAISSLSLKFSNDTKMTSTGLQTYMNGNDHLTMLVLRMGHLITNKVLEGAGEMPHLTSLSIIDSPITEEGMGSLLNRNPQISYLNVAYSCASDAMLQEVAHHPNIQSLELGRTHRCSDQALQKLMEQCPETKFLVSGEPLALSFEQIRKR